jgi:uncharacterized protein (TIGR03546 family)
MLSLLLQPLRQTVRMLVTNDSPRQIAAGAAIGLMLGLAPKGNLIALSLGVLLLSLRVNKSAGLAVAALVSWIGVLADPFYHRLGDKVLAVPSLQTTYAWLYDLPLGPWIGFNNTVVVGALLVGAYSAYPFYLAVKLLLDRFQPPMAKFLMRYKIARAVMGLDFSSRLGAASLGGGS